ncbi:MAG: CHAP domain-containing protein [Clostridia bacterium]|nr:CHAP domain-containing protein [Clostridia bacterium]
MKTTLCVLMSALLLITSWVYPVAADFENTHVLTGRRADDLVAVANTQVGYFEGSLSGSWEEHVSNNYQKYGVWYDEQVANVNAANSSWQCTFVLWCADQVGIGFDTIPNTLYAPAMQAWFEERGLYHLSQANGGTYIPQVGDLVFFQNTGSDVVSSIGIVTEVTDTRVYMVQGNINWPTGEMAENGAVVGMNYVHHYSRLHGFATPAYRDLCGDANGDGQVDTTDARVMLLSMLSEVSERVWMYDVDLDGAVGTSDIRMLLMDAVNG